ncbi:MAG: 4Fe-4S binding protein [Clostridiales Family XIII bacterium]|jgi:formate hydrogenlyase subunit 6/NADH:ubiquinone oxidoreductase subunit I|nr:4Fe-4S binding protein [Clostridiales Family XIII bacterium]
MASFKIAKMIFRSLIGKPATTDYPFKPRVYFDETRGHIEISAGDCILCGICQKKCPCDAITVDRNGRTWKIQRMQCIQCSSCVNVCPKKCLKNDSTYTMPDVQKTVDIISIPVVEKKPANEERKAKIPKVSDTCIYCSLCEKKCPSEAISVDRNDRKWSISAEKCTSCGICIDICPKDSLSF